MHGEQQFENLLSRTILRVATVMLAIVFVLAALFTQSARAQQYKVIYKFTAGSDGSGPEGLTMDAAGNLCGPTQAGYRGSHGTVFELQRSGLGWVLNTLYSFGGGTDGDNPLGGVAIAPDGTLYGTTYTGGASGSGTVFHLTPPPTARAPWKETVLYSFTGGSDGGYPQGDLTVDQMGSIYGTTTSGGYNYGVIYKLTPSGGGWTQAVLYAPTTDYPGGAEPYGGVIFDTAGNLYGGFLGGGHSNSGTVFQLSPSGSGWTMLTLYGFTGGSDGAGPAGGLILDGSGNLYGTTYEAGSGYGGTVFRLTPWHSKVGWKFDTLYDFALSGQGACGPRDVKLVMDADSNLYGTTLCDGAYGYGAVFKLAPSDGGWTYTSLHDFTYGSDGGYPSGDIVLDANGNLFGTAGSNNGLGLVFEITP